MNLPEISLPPLSPLPRSYRRAANCLLAMGALISLPMLSFSPPSSGFVQETFPQRTARIETSCDNLSSQEVESLVTIPLRERIGSLAHVKKVYSASPPEGSLVLVTYRRGISSEEFELSLLKIAERLHPTFPRGTGFPKIQLLEEEKPTILVGLTATAVTVETSEKGGPEGGPTMGLPDSDTIVRKLRLRGAYSQVELYGQYEEEVHIEVDPQALGGSPLTLPELVASLRSSLFDFSAGSFIETHVRRTVELTGGLESLSSLKQLIAAGRNGTTRLSEVAAVSIGRRRDREIFVNERPALLLSLTPKTAARSSGPTTVSILRNHRNIDEDLEKNFPGWDATILSSPYRNLFSITVLLYTILLLGIPLSCSVIRRGVLQTASLCLVLMVLLRIPLSYRTLGLVPAISYLLSLARLRRHHRTRCGRRLWGCPSALGLALALFLLCSYGAPRTLIPAFEDRLPLALLPYGDPLLSTARDPGDSLSAGGTRGNPEIPKLSSRIGEKRRRAEIMEAVGDIWLLPASLIPGYASPSFELLEDFLPAAYISRRKTGPTFALLKELGFIPADLLRGSGGETVLGTPLIQKLSISLDPSVDTHPLAEKAGILTTLEALAGGIEVGSLPGVNRRGARPLAADGLLPLTADRPRREVVLFYGKGGEVLRPEDLPLSLSRLSLPLSDFASIYRSEEPLRIWGVGKDD